MGHPSYSGDLKTALFVVSEDSIVNQEVHGKQFQSITKFMQSYDYSITLGKRKLITLSFLRIKWSLICKNLSLLQLGMHCAKFGWNWPIGSGEEKITEWSWWADDGQSEKLTCIFWSAELHVNCEKFTTAFISQWKFSIKKSFCPNILWWPI